MAEAIPLRGWSFSAASSALWVWAVIIQGFALGWDMAAPLALNENRGKSRFPAGIEN